MESAGPVQACNKTALPLRVRILRIIILSDKRLSLVVLLVLNMALSRQALRDSFKKW